MATPVEQRQTSKATYVSHALNATGVLNNKWFNPSTGLWQYYDSSSDQWTQLWWQSANILTTIGDLGEVDPNFLNQTKQIYKEVFSPARAYNGGNWINGYYDDEGWWALAWIKAWDRTNNGTYLKAAENIFTNLLTGLNATCGGQWWDKTKQHNNAINNELFLAVGAALANRVSGKKSYYTKYAVAQANWFLNAGLQTKNNTFHDGFAVSDCSAEGTVFTYNQGVILGGLVGLYRSTGNSTWLDHAETIATGAVNSLVDSNGIMTETGEYPTSDLTASQFKGVLARNLAYLYKYRKNAAYKTILTKSADSIWSNARSSDGQLASNWQGPVSSFSPPAQGSALDCLVAAAKVSC
ncbi:glycoside hydrolase family 76 protein [Baudoinia panamericana UAMH 10762]|uniref:Glycoside hydrolase family 76 protein n=1 Tax=Baudoinia panamericana (strain UAMH 10762) TaxID=717646 RepID=M2NCZ3_BAUPA|nr:glycoside hydrolase family 76 protein [Baudoinia panamericana UAMH 10762]EMC97064.1 glycoside hydrolase family 76 protein [Baudoinia panamericana UAMH 10762]